MLQIKNLRTFYGKIEVLKDVSLSVNEGEIVALVGANGAGKTTLLKTISGLLRPACGKINFRGKEINGLPAYKIVNRGIVCIPEGRKIFARLSVIENLMLGCFICNDKTAIKTGLNKIYELFPLLRERGQQMGGTLSGGEQQMLAIGRGLMGNPKLLLLDEPSMGLAPIIIEKIFSVIKKINQNGLTILLVEQNANLALHLSHRGYVLDIGKIVLEDKSPALLRSEVVKKSYMGE